MAYLKFVNATYSQVTGKIRRAQQLVRSQFRYLEEHPHLAPRNYRRLSYLSQTLHAMSKVHPSRINTMDLDAILDEISSIIGYLQHAA
ncbi:MAG TPA: hypothetical protein VL461_06345 [Dictyobacter sp.]|jgi:hypothetical protein|nr:hypothetical protein [Dictyobacter sp.]